MSFRRYRKVTPTIARTLTEMDFRLQGGTIQTNEGPKSFLPGDALAKDAKDEWPIPVEAIRTSYHRTGEVDADGFAIYQPLLVREACQMPEQFESGGLQGKAGDYLVMSGSSEWPVAREIFEASYQAVD